MRRAMLLIIVIFNLSLPASRRIAAQTDALQLQQVLGWGSNTWGYIDYSPDDRWLAVWSTRGVLLFSTEDYARPPRIIEGTFWNFRFSPDGNILAIAAGDSVKLYNPATGALIRELENTTGGEMTSVSFSPDGKRIGIVDGEFAGQFQEGVSVWDAATGKKLHSLEGSSGEIFWPDNGRLLMTFQGGWEGDPTLKFWDPNTGKPLPTPKGYSATAGDVSADGRLVALAMGQVHLWNAGIRQETRVLPPHMGFIGGLRFSPNAKFLVIWGIGQGGSDQNVLWDLVHDREIPPPQKGALGYVVFSPDSETMTYEYSDGIHLWNTKTYQETAFIPNALHPVYSTNGKQLAYIESDSLNLVISNAASHREIASLNEFGAGVTSVSWSADLQSIKVTHQGQWVRRWDIGTGRLLALHTAVAPPQLSKHYPTISGNGKFGALVSGNKIQVWNIQTDKKQNEIAFNQDHMPYVATLSLNEDGSLLAYSTFGDDFGDVHLWNVNNNQPSYLLKGHTWQVRRTAFSHNGKVLASVGDNTVRLWDVATGEVLAILNDDKYVADQLLFSADDRLLLGTGNGIVLWDIPSQRQIAYRGLTGLGGVTAAAFSADARHLVTGHNSGVAALWSIHLGF